MLRIITDGAGNLKEGWAEEYDIQTIPVNIHVGDKTFLQDVELSMDDFFAKVEESKKIPKTSQPTPYQFVEFIKANAQPGDTLLSINVTSKLSGTHASAVAASRELEGEYKVIPFDSATGSVGMGYMCKIAREMDRAGKSLDEIVAKLTWLRDNGLLIFTLDNLEYARMSGRAGAVSAALATMLNIKPIGTLADGLLQITEKVRTRKAALNRVVELAKEKVGSKPIFLGVLHCRDPKVGIEVMEMGKKILNVKEEMMDELSISLAANFGPGTVVLIAYPLE